MILILQIFLQHQPRRHFIDPAFLLALLSFHAAGDERLMRKHGGITFVPGVYRHIRQRAKLPNELFNFLPFRTDPAVGGVRHADHDEDDFMFTNDFLKTGQEVCVVLKSADPLCDDTQGITLRDTYPLAPVVNSQYATFLRMHGLFIKPFGAFHAFHLAYLVQKPAQMIGVLDVQDERSFEVGVLRIDVHAADIGVHICRNSVRDIV